MKTNLIADGLGLVVPMNIEAMCVAESVGAKFQPETYDFSTLPLSKSEKRPFITESLVSGTKLEPKDPGVHLHWALPDGLTKGATRQDGEGAVTFPKTPDRWLVTRVASDLSNPASPVNKIRSWVVESNYISSEAKGGRPATAVPYNTDAPGKNKPLYRYLGRVLSYETWRTNHQQKLKGITPNTNEEYANGLNALGYGSPTFSASYSTSKSAFGFFDKQADLKEFPGAILLSYQVIGWYHNEEDDPINQLPLQFNQADFKRLLEDATAKDQEILNAYYSVYIEDGAYVLKKGIDAGEQLSVINALSSSGFNFLDGLLNRCKWSLPSSIAETLPNVTHTLYTGTINNVKWNGTEPAFRELSKNMRVAVGNTATEALAALMGKVSNMPNPKDVEWLLNALQLGKLKDLLLLKEVDRTEQLNIELHTNGFNASGGGEFWEISKIDSDKDKTGLKSLNKSLGTLLNELNKIQFDYDRNLNEIESARIQIFMDWYRFIQLVRKDEDNHDHDNLEIGNVQGFIAKQIEELNAKADANDKELIKEKIEAIKKLIPKEYELIRNSALRYWQPAEPVVLFQGDEITPPQRYGGDGRFMANKSMVCRLSSQLVNKLVIPKDVVGNEGEFVFEGKDAPQLPNNMPLPHANQFYALFTESCLLNPLVTSLLCKAAGSTMEQKDIQLILRNEREKYLIPTLPLVLSLAAMDQIQSIVSAADYDYLFGSYLKKDDGYSLNLVVKNLPENELKRLQYILISAGIGPESKLKISGTVPSPVYFVEWDKNPWLPYLLSWKVNYFPVADKKSGSTKDIAYSKDFITKNFILENGDNRHNDTLGKKPQPMQNAIFLTPNVKDNLHEQLQKYIDSQPAGTTTALSDLQEKLKKQRSILSQSLNGFNNGLVMRDQVMQLEVTDLVEDDLQEFTNIDVRNVVGSLNKSAPKPEKYYNPIRGGYLQIESLTIVDAFGYTLEAPKVNVMSNLIIAESLKTNQGNNQGFIYLAPRIAQPSRLQFRWLAANHENLETNSHPSTTPVCGWIMANHIQPGLWFYRAEGTAIGSLSLSEDGKSVLWQVAPVVGSDAEANLSKYFATEAGKKVNEEIKNLIIALYNNNKGEYLKDFLQANDLSFRSMKPSGYQQSGSNAVLMSSPIAVAQVCLGIELKGSPAYSNGWDDLQKEIDQFASDSSIDRVDNGFTAVKFPVRLGKTAQTNDGLLGYFKAQDAYKVYRSISVGEAKSGMVVKRTNNDIELALKDATQETIVTLLLDPRGSVHATTGVLPAKAIDIPPSQYADALENLNMAFLTSPVLYAMRSELMPNPLMPIPAQSGGEWSWLQKELEVWTAQQVKPVDDQANLSNVPQEIREGWLLLTNNKK
ncbi:hypothetical protein IM793_16620 [Pedobacter sp. MR2016-19]|uniref:hypothetical protein n=1 Tax=Pedobacter sp. MR2016-19 TaxID=2780089 RepID=UPI0018769CD7|nr:hypothetical protein [Pedobacter sp. MR2016-19]MBE5320795.1 hypothetical protein [Pedobacter sp. MR2016-19]